MKEIIEAIKQDFIDSPREYLAVISIGFTFIFIAIFVFALINLRT